MNRWISLSIEYANQRSYLDDLFQVYPTIPDGIRTIDNDLWRDKETNRQIGPLFRRWLNKKSLGIQPVKIEKFLSTRENAILGGGDSEMMAFAREHLNYKHNKGLDFIGRFNGKYVIGEAKFLTDFGGHQNAQFNDAITTIKTKNVKAIKVAVLDGVLYIKNEGKMYRDITTKLKNENIMSGLVFREFLYQI
ncbi:MAG: type II restriction endonuclease [Candidatus Sungbacteria bacterium]|nr:type II restriction endonuclease [Candidatus Sungbacteria bacterium]